MSYFKRIFSKVIFILPIIMIYIINLKASKDIIQSQTYIYTFLIMSVIIPIHFLSNIILNYETISKYIIITNKNMNFWLNKKIVISVVISSLLMLLYFCIFVFIFKYDLKWNIILTLSIFLPLQATLEYLIFCMFFKKSVNLQIISMLPILKFAFIYLLHLKDIDLNFLGIFSISSIYMSNIWATSVYSVVLLVGYIILSKKVVN